MKKLIPVLLIASSALGAVSTKVIEPKWSIERIDRTGQGFRKSAIRRSADGKIHVVFTGCSDAPCKNNEVFYASRDLSGKWNSVSVDPKKKDSGWFVSLEVSSKGIPHIFYADHARHLLRYSTLNERSSFVNSTLSSKWGGWWLASASHQDTIYLVHTKFPEKNMNSSVLELATLQGEKWTYQTVDHGVTEAGWFSSIATDQKGFPVISYANETGYPFGDLKIASIVNGSWKFTDIDGPVVKSSVVVDPKGAIHVIYQKMDPLHNEATDLVYATQTTDNSWKRSMLDSGNPPEGDTGLHPSMSVDFLGGLHVTYRDYYQSALMYARNTGSGWQKTVLDAQGSSGFYSSSLIDEKGGLHVVFGKSQQIFYAYCADCARY